MPNKIVALASIMAISIVAVVMPATGGVDKAKVEAGLTVAIDESLIPEPELKKPEELDVCKPNDSTGNQQCGQRSYIEVSGQIHQGEIICGL